MKTMYQKKNIIWGYVDFTYSGTEYRFIVKYQDGNGYISYNSFSSNERVLKFLEFRGTMHAIVTNETSGSGRLLRLDKINEGSADTWTEVFSSFSAAPQVVEYFEQYLYIITTAAVWKYDYDAETVTSVTGSLPSPYFTEIFDSIYFENNIYIYTGNGSTHYLYKYDGNTTFTQEHSFSEPDWPTSFIAAGKRTLIEYKGLLYFISDQSGSNSLDSYNIKTQAVETQLITFSEQSTVLMVQQGVIFIAIYDSSSYLSNVLTYVPEVYEKENTLVSGEGKVLEGLRRVESDPIFLIADAKLGKVNNFREYPVTAVLGGVINPVIKYGSRLEFYTDLVDASTVIEKNLKDSIDDLCSITNNYFSVNARNVATISKRDLVGYSDKYIDLEESTDYGDQIIASVSAVENYEHTFRRITVNWSNVAWPDNTPVSVGSVFTKDFASIQIDSEFVNDPLLAKGLGLNLLENMDVTEKMTLITSLLYFFEGNEIVGVNVSEGPFLIDKSREWKIYKVEHNREQMTTTLTLLERSLLEEREVA